MSVWDIVEDVAADIIETGEQIIGPGAEIVGASELLFPGFIEILVQKFLAEVSSDDDSGGSQVRPPQTQVESADLLLAEAYKHAYGETDDIITVPDAVIANLANADTTVAPDNWSDTWSFILEESFVPVDDASTFAEGIVDVGDYAGEVSGALATEAVLAPEPITDPYMTSVYEAPTSLWTSAFLA